MRVQRLQAKLFDRRTFEGDAGAGFVPLDRPQDEIVILGYQGSLNYFRSIFDRDHRQVELVPTEKFPGAFH